MAKKQKDPALKLLLINSLIYTLLIIITAFAAPHSCKLGRLSWGFQLYFYAGLGAMITIFILPLILLRKTVSPWQRIGLAIAMVIFTGMPQ